MTYGFVIGNGVSRQGVNLRHLQNFGKIYGCNALYRDYQPDVLVATDRPIATAIQESGYAKDHVFYTRQSTAKLGGRALSEKYQGFSSGPNAVALAALDRHEKIFLIGFDMGPNNNQFNNIYADTEFYKTSKHPPTFTGNWIKQIVQIVKEFPNQRFTRIVGPTTASIKELENLVNLKHLDLADFLDRINNGKDL